ncbi:hypothetical protein CIPAW_03G031400 [Carya illinoinensis]|uniref:Uncharacterized protein n=1 Tax=Carya illinoinensis TaxID=32201 RepID=A0A8T1QYS4_CARIL|nr:hypothetical protein CIPAW_03G031400 [Carya illinoinensis]
MAPSASNTAIGALSPGQKPPSLSNAYCATWLDYFVQVTHELDEPFSKHLQSPHECFERWFMALAETKLLPMISPLFPWTSLCLCIEY